MRAGLTSSENGEKNLLIESPVINENDPKQLRTIISELINKSKYVIHTLETTVSRLEQTEKERDYWKSSYLRFRDSCHKVIDSEGIENFRYLVKLEEQLKNSEIEKKCLEESNINSPLFYSRKARETESKLNSAERVIGRASGSNDFKTAKRKQKIHKSISTVSFNREMGHSEHAIAPKKILVCGNLLNKEEVLK